MTCSRCWNSVAEYAAHICEANVVEIAIVDNEVFRLAASFGEAKRLSSGESVPLDRSTVTGRAICDLQPVQVADLQNAGDEFPLGRELAITHGHRTTLSVPLIRQGRALGAILVRRTEVRPFEEKYIVLLKAFADQAAIAIENVRLFEAEQQRTRELAESLQQQTATADVLKIISRSTFDLKTVLNTLAESAARLCAADKGLIFQQDGDVWRLTANYGFSPEAEQYAAEHPFQPNRGSVTGRVALEGKAIHIADVLADPEYGAFARGYQRAFGYRTYLGVPLPRDGMTIGSFSLTRDEVSPFTEKQIELATTFAAQAVIAIENARLLNELRQRTADLSQRTTDLTELLEQQTATSEVLQVISSSPGDLEPVFSTMLEKALRICDAKFGMLYRHESGRLRLMAARDVPPMFAAAQEGPFTPAPGGMLDSVMKTGRTVHLPDLAATQAYLERHPIMVEAVELGGVRTVVGVPMIHENELIGLIGIYRQDVRPFTDKQIALLTSFAAQASIAIENARLLNELRESLQEQTATSEVLQVISSSPGDVQPVFDAMLEKAARICDATFGNIYRWDGDTLHLVGTHNTPPALVEARRRSQIRPNPRMPVGRMLATKTTVHVADLAAEPVYTEERDATIVAGVELGGIRTFLLVPMLKETELIGVFSLYRQEVRLFTEKQIALVTNFAAQAVIAIENARLLNELRQSLQQQTATSEVLQVISRFPGDLQPVFEAVLANATGICDAKFGLLWLTDRGGFRCVALHNVPPAFADYYRSQLMIHPASGTGLRRLADTRQVAQIPDMTKIQPYIERDPFVVTSVELGGYRSVVNVPMLKDEELIGAISIYRQEVGTFTETQIELVSNFASQAVIAIENARLLNELRQSLQRQTATSEVLQVISGSPGELEPVFATMLEKAVRICDAKFGCLYLHENGVLRLVAAHDVPEFFEARRGIAFEPVPGGPLEETMRGRRTIQIVDLVATKAYIERHPLMVEAVELAGIRTAVAVPMLKEGELIGIVSIHRREVLPFTDKQIELLTNFAAQAVIALENARLLNELREFLRSKRPPRTCSRSSPALRVSCNRYLPPCWRKQFASATRHLETFTAGAAAPCTSRPLTIRRQGMPNTGGDRL